MIETGHGVSGSISSYPQQPPPTIGGPELPPLPILESQLKEWMERADRLEAEAQDAVHTAQMKQRVAMHAAVVRDTLRQSYEKLTTDVEKAAEAAWTPPYR